REVTVRAADDEQLDSVIVGVDGHAETVPAPFVADGIKDDEMVHTVRVSGPGDHRVEAFAVDRAQNASTVVQRTVTTSTPTPPPGPTATGSGPAPAGPPPAPPAQPSGGPSGAGSSSDATPRHPAKLEVPRVRVHRGRLDVLARITERATGELRAT